MRITFFPSLKNRYRQIFIAIRIIAHDTFLTKEYKYFISKLFHQRLRSDNVVVFFLLTIK